MSKYYIYVEDRAEVEDQLFSVQANSIEDAQKIFCKAYVPYIKQIDWRGLEEMLASIDIYIHIVSTDNAINL